MARVIVAMSGGVDSSVAAWLLKEQGHEVIGLFMRHGQGTGWGDFESRPTGDSPKRTPFNPGACLPQRCCTAADADDARRVADRLGIAFYALNFEEEFGRIVDYFVDEYLAGRTPNPCIVCNTWLKFGKLVEYADGIGAQYVATGHYARLAPSAEPGRVDPGGFRVQGSGFRVQGSGPASPSLAPSPQFPAPSPQSPAPSLLCGCDPGKDQSYVLFGVRRGLLARLKLPVGDYRKLEIRRLAARLGLSIAEKPDSQEICFVPDDDHARLVRERRPGVDTSGEIVTTDGVVVGRHPGLEHFTIGQRKGLRVAFGQRRYVVRLEPQTRRVVVGTAEELARQELTAAQANWLVEPPSQPLPCQVKIRYRSPAVPAVVYPLPYDRFRVVFDRACYGVAPGQAAVCYQDDRVLGGGWIE
jgi:tRNA-specific 2-thiouridylase